MGLGAFFFWSFARSVLLGIILDNESMTESLGITAILIFVIFFDYKVVNVLPRCMHLIRKRKITKVSKKARKPSLGSQKR